MKKIIFILLIFTTLQAFSQGPPRDDYTDELTPIDSTINSYFRDIDLTVMQSGIFAKNYILGFDFSDYSGSVGSEPINREDFHNIYEQFRKFYLDTLEKPVDTDTLIWIEDIMSNYDTVAMTYMLLEYEKFSDQAIDDSLITIDTVNNKVIVPDTTYSALYETENIALSVVSREYVFGSSIYFNLEKSIYFTNIDSISYLSIDFDDGTGYSSYLPNTIVSVEYGYGFINSGEKTINTWVHFNNGDSLLCSTTLYVNAFRGFQLPVNTILEQEEYYGKDIADMEIRIDHEEISTWYDYNDDTTIVTDIESFIYLGCGNEIFDNPFIVVEGFDPENEMYPWSYKKKKDAPSYQCKDTTKLYKGLIQRLDDNGDKAFRKLLESGYDVVVVNFGYGGVSIWKNSSLLRDMIDSINYHKVGNGENVLMGVSMGGLLGRTALKIMENENRDHETETFITIDTPHNGAYIPLGIQSIVWDMYKHMHSGSRPSSLKKNKRKLTCTAAREMLMMYIDERSSWNSINEDHLIDYTHNTSKDYNLRKDFYDSLKAVGFPEQTINIGVSNGSVENRKNGISASEKLIDIWGDKIKDWNIPVWPGLSPSYDMYHQIYAMPASSSTGYVATSAMNFPTINLLFGKIQFGGDDYGTGAGNALKRYVVNPTGLDEPIENLSGGYTDVLEGTYTGFRELLECSWVTSCGWSQHPDKNACFIPTMSSLALKLDFAYQYLDTNIAVLLENNPELTSFDKWYATPYNTYHAFAEEEMNYYGNKSTKENLLSTMINDFLDDNLVNLHIQDTTISGEFDFKAIREIYCGNHVQQTRYDDTDVNNQDTGDVVFEVAPVNAEGDIVAGEAIFFKDGTHFKIGSDCHAYIDENLKPICANNSTRLPEFKTDDDATTLKNDIVSVYPNPSRDRTNVEFIINENNTLVNLYLIDNSGYMIEKFYDNAVLGQNLYAFDINTEKIPSGSYSLVLETIKGQSVKKLIIIK
jgi:type IX secretion system substrate protein